MNINEFHQIIEKQKAFENGPNPRLIREYKCKNCNGTSFDIGIKKIINNKNVYEQLRELENLVNEHNNNIEIKKKNKSLFHKIFNKNNKDVEWWITHSANLSYFAICDDICDYNKKVSFFLSIAYVKCPYCKYKHTFIMKEE